MEQEFIRVARAADFADTRMKTFRILARHVAVFKEHGGRFRAMEFGCRHANANLAAGRIQGHVVTCAQHGWQYDLRTGACLRGGDAPLRHYAVKVENGFVYIGLAPLEQHQEED